MYILKARCINLKKVFIDGSAGTTGLKIHKRLSQRNDIELIILPDDMRKDINKRKEMLNSCDIAFLCLPDAAAKEAVSLIENENVTVIDASTAHRTNKGWAYGFPELDETFYQNIASSKRIAVPGCHASGFIALVYPLVKNGILPKDALLSCHSLTGYSGGGKSMIADYESDERSELLNAPRQYALSQSHKHLPEMKAICGIENAPIFSPIVADFYSGMEVTVPLFTSQLNGAGIDDICKIYKSLYKEDGKIVRFTQNSDTAGFLSAATLSQKDCMLISAYGNDERIILTAVYDNLGKGACGAAIECMNISMGIAPEISLNIF